MRSLMLILLCCFGSELKSQRCTLYIDSTADCGLTCIGTATAYPTGQAPFTYLWQPGGQTTRQISNLCPGSYTVTVTDSLGCIVTDSVTVNGSPVLNVWISSLTSPTCVGCSDVGASGSVIGFIILHDMTFTSVAHDIIKGLATGIFGGIGVYLISYIRELQILKRDKKRIFDFLVKQSLDQEKWDWRTTRVIANNTNLEESRVRYVCSIDDRIDRSDTDKEVWQIRKSS